MTNHGGSAHDARLQDLAIDEAHSAPSLSVYKKYKAEFRHKDVPTNDWIINILYLSRLEDYVHEVTIFKQFLMQLHIDQSIKALNNIPYSHRIAYLDSSGGLVKIP